MEKWINCRMCNRRTKKTKYTKKFCSNKCRVKYHRLKHGINKGYDPYEIIKCNYSNCPNFRGETARWWLPKVGCMGECIRNI